MTEPDTKTLLGSLLEFKEEQIVHDMSPRSLSAWLELAVADLRRFAVTPGFVVNMGVFYVQSRVNPHHRHEDYLTPQCQMCLAGSVLAGAGVSTTFERDVFNYLSADSQELLQAINQLRNGNIDAALDELGSENRFIDAAVRPRIAELRFAGNDCSLEIGYWEHKKSASDQQPFYDGMDRVVAKLKELGI